MYFTRKCNKQANHASAISLVNVMGQKRTPKCQNRMIHILWRDKHLYLLIFLSLSLILRINLWIVNVSRKTMAVGKLVIKWSLFNHLHGFQTDKWCFSPVCVCVGERVITFGIGNFILSMQVFHLDQVGRIAILYLGKSRKFAN